MTVSRLVSLVLCCLLAASGVPARAAAPQWWNDDWEARAAISVEGVAGVSAERPVVLR